VRYTVILDACVLYPAPLRDFLLRLATTGLFRARWTQQIHDEWMRNVLKKRPELKPILHRTRELIDRSVPDALVTGYEPLVEGLELPDVNDRHVLAAAIRAGAQAVITFNLKDFPDKTLGQYDIEAMRPDEFVEHQLDLHQGTIIAAAKQHRAALRNPPKTTAQYIETLAAQGLIVCAERLREFEALI
jgi:predicted nucleic acid-binding protein